MEAEQKAEAVDETEDNVIKLNPVKKILMGELGASLPIGANDPGTGGLVKTMEWRNWNLKVEKVLGKMRDEHRDQGSNMARFAAMIVAFLYKTLGTTPFAGDPKKIISDILTVGSMWMGDVLYAYLWLRKEFVGDKFDMDCTCPTCVHKFNFKADLSTVEVRTVNRLEDSYWEYRLRHPFEVRGEMIKALKMGPARWSGLEKGAATGMLDTGGTKSALIWASLHDIVDRTEPLLSPVVEQELEEMSKLDVEALTAGIDVHHIGPDMSIEGTCPRCRVPFKMSIDWVYDNFFAVSGRSAKRTK